MNMNNSRLNKKNSLLLVVDVQEKLFDYMLNKEELKKNIIKLLKAFRLLGLPVIFIEQNPEGLGKTIKEIRSAGKNEKFFTKMTFGLNNNPDILNYIKKLEITNIIICGIEAHVCVYQCGLDLINSGYIVHIVTDAVSSRKKTDIKTAITRLIQEKALCSSTEMSIFDLLKTCTEKEFKPILEIVK